MVRHYGQHINYFYNPILRGSTRSPKAFDSLRKLALDVAPLVSIDRESDGKEDVREFDIASSERISE